MTHKEWVEAKTKFFNEFIIPMLNEKSHMKNFGDLTIYLELETYDETREFRWEKTFNLDYDSILAKWNKWIALNSVEEKYKALNMPIYDIKKDEFRDLRFIEVYMSYPRKLVKNGLCHSYHGSSPYCHCKAHLFECVYKDFNWLRVSTEMMAINEDSCPFYKYYKCVLHKKPLFINGKEYKNYLIVQKHIIKEKSIPDAKHKGLGLLLNTKYVGGNLTVTSDKGALLYGDASNINGDISNIYGEIHPNLTGDVSGISGCITNLYGDVTNIKLYIKQQLKKPTNIQVLLNPEFVKHYCLLSNEENQKLLKIWSALSHHTIGVTDEERKLFDNPIKCEPPFKTDKWGRHYVEEPNEEYMWVFSVNPADIMFAKDVNKCSTCFCLNSGSSKWILGMRCLIALNSVNPNLGVAFKIKKNSVKKMNQFTGIKFKWYEPEAATFFQYNSSKMYIWNRYEFKNNFSFPAPTCDACELKDVKSIYGHDGLNIGHDRQKELAYLETFIKDGYKWYRGPNKDFPLTNNDEDFCEKDISDDWKQQIEIANKKASEIIEMLKGDK